MIVTTTSMVPGKIIKQDLGLVMGNTIRAKWFGKDIMAGLKQIVGGELKGYTDMMSEARQQALDRAVDAAKEKGADAIVGLRFTTSSVMASAAEILAYGTAVKLGDKV